MSKEEYLKQLDRYVKQDKEGKLVIDMDEVLKDKGTDKLDDEEPITDKEMLGFSIKFNKKRYVAFPDRLPADKLPRPVDEHSRMGLYESKRDLYLTIAHAYNKLMERLEALEAEVQSLKGNS